MSTFGTSVKLSKSVFSPNDQHMMLQNLAWVKDPFKVQRRSMDFNVPVCKIPRYGFRIHIVTNLQETTTCQGLV